MNRQAPRYLILAAFYGLTAVALGALGQHAFGLEAGSRPYLLFQHAYIYQLIHALLLIWVATQLHHGFWLRAAALAIAVGVLLFCGGLYVLIFLGQTAFSWITPIGGSLLILGWLNLVIHGVKQLFKPQ
ncbi:DUF423 domain-containing protein [Marinicella pacifica]|uniref:DUF423 domain-containing protein n=1 Tax=Marinicella pacifica TaxID=1171543 RepID=A0A917CJK8_9GAMM|nr:DUF423 domain-containing protein [Marinicella pacifica]GGF90910.1 DUF423 domain-containing protein [Marinicella pacifica]